MTLPDGVDGAWVAAGMPVQEGIFVTLQLLKCAFMLGILKRHYFSMTMALHHLNHFSEIGNLDFHLKLTCI